MDPVTGVVAPETREKIRAAQEIPAIPPLAQWDSFWFHDIAQQGYTGQPASPETAWPLDTTTSHHRQGFVPLYPLAMCHFAQNGQKLVFTRS